MADATGLALAALAKVSSIEAGTTTITDPRVSPLSQSLGITYDGNNNVTTNTTDNRIGILEVDTHTHVNKIVLDNTTASFTTELDNKINAIASVFGITFNVDGTLNTENYTLHTHNYADNNGTIDTTRTTTGIN